MHEYAIIDKNNAYIYFILIIICGNIMLFNLFLSILISNYEAEFSNFIQEAEGKLRFNININYIFELIQKLINILKKI